MQADDEDCARSAWCAQFGNCKLGVGPGGCVKDATRFPDSEACRRYGCCGRGQGARCRPRNDEDCKSSVVCAKEGRCSLRTDECVRSCKDTADCRLHGLCTDAPATTCVAGSDAECAASGWCRSHAECVAKGGKCVVTDASCAAHQDCREYASCWARNGRCVATERAYREHEQCRKLGRCGLVDGGCRATTSAHCKQSEICAKGGYCRMAEGHCERN